MKAYPENVRLQLHLNGLPNQVGLPVLLSSGSVFVEATTCPCFRCKSFALLTSRTYPILTEIQANARDSEVAKTLWEKAESSAGLVYP